MKITKLWDRIFQPNSHYIKVNTTDNTERRIRIAPLVTFVLIISFIILVTFVWNNLNSKKDLIRFQNRLKVKINQANDLLEEKSKDPENEKINTKLRKLANEISFLKEKIERY